jgi:hypothetical protein
MILISGNGEISSRLHAFSLFFPGTCPNNRDRRDGTAHSNTSFFCVVDRSPGVLHMLSKLSCAALLMVPSLAYGENPSADLSVQIVPPGDVIACDIGPNYSGSIPAAARAAGFTHCAANYNFTSTTNFTYNGTTYNFSNPATWLDCAGASSPLFWASGYGFSTSPPCSRYSIVSDGGDNALHLLWTATDAANGTEMTWMAQGSRSGLFGSGTEYSLPQSHYTEVQFRSTAATLSALPSGADILSYFSFKHLASNTTWLEYDTTELFSPNGRGGGGCIDWYNGGGPDYVCNVTQWQVSNTSLDPTTYNTYAEYAKSDGSAKMSKCAYLNGVEVYCSQWSPNILSVQQRLFTNRNYWGFGVGDQNQSPPRTPNANMEIFIRQITFWEPPNCAWQTQQCNVSVP